MPDISTHHLAASSFPNFISKSQFVAQFPRQFTAVIFDCDGLLLDTEPIYSRAMLQVAREIYDEAQSDSGECESPPHMQPYPTSVPADLKAAIMGQSREHVAQALCTWLSQSYRLHCNPQDWCHRAHQHEQALFKLHVPLLPGVPEFIQAVAVKHQLDMAIATSAPRQAFVTKTKDHWMLSSFDCIVCGDELLGPGDNDAPCSGFGKPHPRIFQVTSNRLSSSPPHRTPRPLVFEDSPNGVVAALRAGFPVVWIPSSEIRSVATPELIYGALQPFLHEFTQEQREGLWIYQADSFTELLAV